MLLISTMALGFVWPDDQTILLSVDSVVLGCHREKVGEEMECVDELGKVEDLTTTSAYET